MISISSFGFGPPPAEVTADRALVAEEVRGEALVDDCDLRSFFTSACVKSRPSSIGICIVLKYSGDSAFMNACMSSPSAAYVLRQPFGCPIVAGEDRNYG